MLAFYPKISVISRCFPPHSPKTGDPLFNAAAFVKRAVDSPHRFLRTVPAHAAFEKRRFRNASKAVSQS